MRMLQVCAVDFTAYHLIGPLLRASRRDGWDVEFSSADGPFAAMLREISVDVIVNANVGLIGAAAMAARRQ